MVVLPCAILVLIYGAGQARSLTDTEQTYDKEQADRHHREKVICGPNAVYLLLTIYRCRTSETVIADAMPNDPQGMSLIEIRDALAANGLDAVLRRQTTEQLVDDWRPCIIHTKPNRSSGHYLVLLSIAGSDVHLLDPTSGRSMETKVKYLSKTWSGYVIAPRRADRFGLYAWGSIIAGTVILTYVICRPTVAQTREPRHANQTSEARGP